MKEKSAQIHFERRWPVGIAIISVIALLTMLPDRVTVAPLWVTYVFGIVLILPMFFIAQTNAGTLWLHIERIIMILFIITNMAGLIINISSLIKSIIGHTTELSGLQLLTSSIGIWVTNVITFSLAYWQIDCGGPEARLKEKGIKPDLHFPQYETPGEVPDRWRPVFADYLFLSFTAATAFSPTDVLPLTIRAKMVIMFESSVSLVTIVIVASRAINILGN